MNLELTPLDQQATTPWREGQLMAARGYEETVTRIAGCTFENGLYRIHDETSGPPSRRFITETFPEFSERVVPFAYDWLGRQFGLDSARVADGEALILMMEPGTGQALEIPMSFRSFHEELGELREPALAESFFLKWSASNPGYLPLAPTGCVGYKVPLFLGGLDSIENLEVIDLDVYWSVCGQLRRGTRRMPAGTSIRQIAIE